MNAAVLVLAGSETTATLLCGAVYLLGLHPDILAKVVHEVRTSFKMEDEIDLISVNALSYMLACLNETFRMYPPAPAGLPRVVPKGGCNVAGHWIPQDVSFFPRSRAPLRDIISSELKLIGLHADVCVSMAACRQLQL